MAQEVTRKQQVIGAAVVVIEGKILLLKRADNETNMPGVWELPSGKKELGERLEPAVIRECAEESGLDIKIHCLIDYFEYGTQKEGLLRDCTQLNFLASLIDPDQEVVLSEEHQDFRWVSEEELDQVGNGKVGAVLHKAFEFIRKECCRF